MCQALPLCIRAVARPVHRVLVHDGVCRGLCDPVVTPLTSDFSLRTDECSRRTSYDLRPVEDLTELLRALRKRGWSVEKGKKHWICRPPGEEADRFTIISSTPSGSRWLYAALKDLKRLDPQFTFRGR